MVWATDVGVSTPINGQTVRSAPSSDFTWFTNDFTITQCTLDGQARLNKSVIAMAMSKYSADLNTNSCYVAPWGSDSNNGTSPATPFLTLSKAIRSSSMSHIYVFPGRYLYCDYRATDTGTGKLKIVEALGDGVVICDTTGTHAQEMSFTVDGSGNYYNATISGTPMRVLRTDRRDKTGRPIPLKKATSTANLATMQNGWYFTGTTLSIRINSGGDVTKYLQDLQVVYGTSAARCLIYGNAKIAYKGIKFEGVYPYALQLSGGSPTFFAENCEFLYSFDHGVLAEGGTIYLQNCYIHRVTADGIGYKTSGGIVGLGAEIDCIVEYSGDSGTYGDPTQAPLSDSWNRNGSSCHDGGAVVRVNGIYRYNSGPDIVDAGTVGQANVRSWNVGTVAYGSVAPAYGSGIAQDTQSGFYITEGKMWCDTCNSWSEWAEYYATASGTLYMYNSIGSTAKAVGTVSQYSI